MNIIKIGKLLKSNKLTVILFLVKSQQKRRSVDVLQKQNFVSKAGTINSRKIDKNVGRE